MLDEIKRQFSIERLQYVCVAQEMSDQAMRSHLHIQIVLKEKLNKRTWFLDDVTSEWGATKESSTFSKAYFHLCENNMNRNFLFIETHCNYQVTKNDRAWNEYIKKGQNFIEFGTFKSTTVRGRKQWPQLSVSSLGSSAITHSTRADGQLGRPTTAAVTSARAKAEEKRAFERELARQALAVARTSIYDAMDMIKNAMPEKFLAHSSW